MIEIADLWKAFGAVQVLKGVSLRVERGSVVAIIGPSGSGNRHRCAASTCSRSPIAGASASVSAKCVSVGLSRTKPADRELSAFRASTGMVFQHFNLFPHMTALGNVMAGPTIVKRLARREAEESPAACSPRSGSPTRPTPIPRTSPADSGSASRSRGPWR